MRPLMIFAFVFLSYCAKGQKLSLDEIINIRTMDSLTLMKFSNEKGFELKEIDMDAWRTVHKYYAKADSSISFERTFPTVRRRSSKGATTENNGMVYYHFSDKEDLDEFKGRMKERGFKFKRTDSKDYGGNIFIHNIYLAKDKEIDLASQKLHGQKTQYTLMYYNRMN